MTVQRPLPERALPRALVGAPSIGAPPALPANATLAARNDITATLAGFAIELDAPLDSFVPGQYVSVGLERAGDLIQRPYSIVALDATRTRIELFIRRLPSGCLSNMLWPLPAGARLRVGPPRGLFMLDRQDTRPRLMVGTGTGLAPLLAMLGDAAARGDLTPAALIHGVSFHAELAYSPRIATWTEAGLPLDYRPTVSRPRERRNESWRGRTGRAEKQLATLLDDSPAMRTGTAYLCGNPEMIDACRTTLLEAGFAAADVRSEQFHAPVMPRFA